MNEKTLQRLMQIGGERSDIASDIEARVYARVQQEWLASSQRPQGERIYDRVHGEWQKAKRRKVLTRWALPVALAASAILTLAIVLRPVPQVPESVFVATVAKVVATADGTLQQGDAVYAGERLETGPGEGISLLLARNESLRLGENSALEMISRNSVRLVNGMVYLDTGDFVYRDGGIVVETAFGTVTDIGTQFVVLHDGQSLDVAVREGRVDINRGPEVVKAVAGERLQVSASGTVMVEQLAANDAFWNWASALAPALDLNDKSLLELLRWAARETGLELVFEDDELRMRAMRTDIHGSVSNFTPLEVLESVLATTTFRYRIEADRIVIQR